MNWPKSYAKLYYSNIADEIFQRNESPNILEINNKARSKAKLWNCFFNNPNIIMEKIDNLDDFLNSQIINEKLNFELIIINNYKDIDNIFLIINLLKNKLNHKGILIVENVHQSLILVSKIFFLLETNILDFRLNKFLINNCLLEIKKGNIISIF